MGTDEDEGSPPTQQDYIAAADRVLHLDLTRAPATGVSQVALGWMRAAMLYGREIARSQELGTQIGMSPVRRSFFEALMRLQWLFGVEDRGQAVRSMIAKERQLADRNELHLQELGVPGLVDIDDLRNIETGEPASGSLRQQAAGIVDAAKASSAAALYRAWYLETQKTHATVNLAISMAPEVDGKLQSGAPEYPNLENLFGLLTLAMSLSLSIVDDEGAESALTKAHWEAFLPLQLSARE